MRLIDGKALVKLKGAHPGDKARYNHQTQRAIWSPDEAWLIAVNESEWATDHANAYRIGRDSVSDPLLQERGRKVQIDKFQQWIDVKSVNNDGTIAAVCYIQIMKQDDAYQFIVTPSFRQSRRGETRHGQAMPRSRRRLCFDGAFGLRVCAVTRTEGIGEDMTTFGRTSLACPTPSPVLA